MTSLRLHETEAGLGRDAYATVGDFQRLSSSQLLHTTFFTRADFLLHGVVLSAVVPVALKRFTAFNMIFLLFYHLTSVKPLPLFQRPFRLLVRVMLA